MADEVAVKVEIADLPKVRSALQQAQDALAERNREIESLKGHVRRLERSNQSMGERLNKVRLLRSAGLIDALRREARSEQEVALIDDAVIAMEIG